MAFKINPPYHIDNTPIYKVDFKDGAVHGVTLNTGAIVINRHLPTDVESQTVSHEMVHVDQIKRGDLSYDDKYVYWCGKKYPRSKMKEGDKNLPWEKEAYTKQKRI